MGWALLTIGLLALFVTLMLKVNAAYALGCCSLLSLLAPTWLDVQIAGLPLDARAAAAAAGLAIYCCQPKMWPRVRTPWVIADWSMVALGAAHVVSDAWNVGCEWALPLRALGEWGLPYIAGRQAIQNLPDARRLTSVACAVAIVLAGLAVTESVGGTNLVNRVAGARPKDSHETKGSQRRMGLTRAEGVTRHPIWLGMLQFLLFPWTARAAAAAWKEGGPRWLLAAPLVSCMGVFFTLSRGPMLALALAACLVALCRLARWRKPLFAVCAALVVAGFVGRDDLLDFIHAWGGELRRSHQKMTVVIDGEQEEISSARHRLLVAWVYRKAMLRAGLVGFGTDATATFPVRVPVGVMPVETLKMFWSIDDYYVLMQLRFGLLGVLTFVAAGALAATYSLRPAWRPEQPEGVFLAALGGTIASTMVILWAEWMPTDFGFFFLWLCGASSSLKALAPSSLADDVGAAPRAGRRPRPPLQENPAQRRPPSRRPSDPRDST